MLGANSRIVIERSKVHQLCMIEVNFVKCLVTLWFTNAFSVMFTKNVVSNHYKYVFGFDFEKKGFFTLYFSNDSVLTAI